jgi:hypothetical protein
MEGLQDPIGLSAARGLVHAGSVPNPGPGRNTELMSNDGMKSRRRRRACRGRVRGRPGWQCRTSAGDRGGAHRGRGTGRDDGGEGSGDRAPAGDEDRRAIRRCPRRCWHNFADRSASNRRGNTTQTEIPPDSARIVSLRTPGRAPAIATSRAPPPGDDGSCYHTMIHNLAAAIGG